MKDDVLNTDASIHANKNENDRLATEFQLKSFEELKFLVNKEVDEHLFVHLYSMIFVV